ncbi:MAG: hypothetical protein ACOVOA_18215, partial [Allorhizobium sp.]
MHGNQRIGGTEAQAGSAGKAGAVVGIDLGGTKILAGIADLEGRVLATLRQPTEHGPGAPVLDQMARIVVALAAEAGLDVKAVR